MKGEKEVFVLLLALHTTLSSEPVTTGGTGRHGIGKALAACHSIKCPSEERRLCVKMRHKTGGLANKSVYVIMANKCELKYVNCYKQFGEIQTTVLPMKFCEHKGVANPQENKVRSKRSAKVYAMEAVPREKALEYGLRALKEKRNLERKESGIKGKKSVLDGRGFKIKKMKKKSRKPQSSKKQKKKKLGRSKNSTEIVELVTPRQGEESAEAISSTGDDVSKSKEKAHLDESKMKFRGPDELEKKHHLNVADGGEDSSGAVGGDDDEELLFVPDRNSLTTEKVDIEQYNADCPTVCPARVLMVCGRCKHGIYRTFMSVCHLRKFACAAPKEELQLTSRSPCALSAPFLANLKFPQGVVEEQEDDDPVLRYITCRGDMRGFRWMRLNDPRCNFFQPKKYLLHSDENVYNKNQPPMAVDTSAEGSDSDKAPYNAAMRAKGKKGSQ